MAMTQDTHFRDRFLLRLVCAKFSHLFTLVRPIVSRSVVDGIETYMIGVFGDAYDELNQHMGLVLEDLEGVPDPDVWRYIYDNDVRYHAPVCLMLALLAPFADFAKAMKTLMAAVDAKAPQDKSFRLTEEKFYILFGTWFGDLFAFMAENRPRFDILYGVGTRAQVEAIRKEFQRRAPADVAFMAAGFDK